MATAQLSRSLFKPQADCMESAIAALYLEKGLDAVRDWVRKTYKPLVKEAIRTRNEMCVLCIFTRERCFIASSSIIV